MNNKMTGRTKLNNKPQRIAYAGKKWTTMALLGCLFGLSACGNKGDLYLPKETVTSEATEIKSENPEQAIE